MSDKRYEFNILCLGGVIERDGFYCMFKNFEYTLEIFEILKKSLNLQHIQYVGGLMCNIRVKGKKAVREWSDIVSQFVSLDNKVEKLSNQIFYFAINSQGKLLPSNQL